MSEAKEYWPCADGEQGNIKISEDVVAAIATIAVAETEGVASISSAVDITEVFTRKSPARGVKITFDPENGCIIDCAIILKYGSAVAEVARNVQKNVKAALESMAGIHSTVINVQVTGIQLPKTK